MINFIASPFFSIFLLFQGKTRSTRYSVKK